MRSLLAACLLPWTVGASDDVALTSAQGNSVGRLGSGLGSGCLEKLTQPWRSAPPIASTCGVPTSISVMQVPDIVTKFGGTARRGHRLHGRPAVPEVAVRPVRPQPGSEAQGRSNERSLCRAYRPGETGNDDRSDLHIRDTQDVAPSPPRSARSLRIISRSICIPDDSHFWLARMGVINSAGVKTW